MNLKRTVGVTEPVAYAVSMQVISGKVQGMAFYNNKILLTRSWGILPSEVQIFNLFQIWNSCQHPKLIRRSSFRRGWNRIYQDGGSHLCTFRVGGYAYRMSSINRIDRSCEAERKQTGKIKTEIHEICLNRK